eukprot:6228299-Amphidinium_carterae.1
MKEPREGDWIRLMRVGEFLLRHPCMVNVFRPQEAPTHVRVIVDSDHAGERSGAPPPELLQCSATTVSEDSQTSRA